jgi:ribosome biogenesis GTPase
MAKKKQLRASFRKNRTSRARRDDWTKQFHSHGFAEDDTARDERISGKGELTRKRTIQGQEVEDTGQGLSFVLDVDRDLCLPGRVMRVAGLRSTVEVQGGELYECATRRLLKTLATDQRHVVAVGDRVWIRPTPQTDENEGIIERIEPRYGVLSRTSRGRQQTIVSNVDQLVIITSAAEPVLKPNLIDRFLVTAEKGDIEPVICINKVDLVPRASLMPLVGVYSQLGYRVLLTSATQGFGIEALRRMLDNRQSVLAGQSGVGKSSLLNAIEEGLHLRVAAVSTDTQKGRHTTTSAELLKLGRGGYVVDTPGIRQFQLWDVIPEEVAGFYPELRPYVSHCRYADCTHHHEDECAVKDAVADDQIDVRRYESYLHLYAGDLA